MNRRHFSIMSTGAALAAAGWGKSGRGGTDFFRLGERKGSPTLIDPAGAPFFALGLNQPGRSAGPSARERREWERHYGRDARAWIESTRESLMLRQANFNVSGSGDLGDGTAYCHLVPFNAAGRWQERGRQCDYLARDWEEWCDHVAKQHCAPRAGDRHLVGYFYSEAPCWRQGEVHAEWPAVRLDPDLLASRAGRRRLRQMARRYHRVTRDAIRRHDPHHLILGVRYEASADLPDEVLEEALPRVDVLSLQDFQNPAANLRGWHARTGMPVLLADTAPPGPQRFADRDRLLTWHAELAAELLPTPGCVGLHLSAPTF